MIKKNFISLILIIILNIPTNVVFATKFVGRDEAKIFIEDASFLKKIGVKAQAEKIVNEEGKTELAVTFSSFKISGHENIESQLLYLNSESQLLLAIEHPFVNGEHSSRYVILEGHSLMVAIRIHLERGANDYQVIFSNAI